MPSAQFGSDRPIPYGGADRRCGPLEMPVHTRAALCRAVQRTVMASAPLKRCLHGTGIGLRQDGG